MANASNLIPYQWKKGQSGNPKGGNKRRGDRVENTWWPRIVEAQLKEACPDLSPRELQAAVRKTLQEEPLSPRELSSWRQRLITATKGMLTALVKNADGAGIPAFAVVKSIGILYDMKNGKTATIDSLVAEEYGTAAQQLAIVDNRTRFDVMTEEEMDAEIERLRRAYENANDNDGTEDE